MATSSANRGAGSADGTLTVGGRLRGSALARIVIGVGVILGATAATALVLQRVALALFGPAPTPDDQWLGGLVAGLFLAAAVFAGYVLYHRLVDGAWPADLQAVHLGRDLVGGTLAGAGLFTVALGAVWLAGGYRVVAVNPLAVVLPAVTGVVFFVGIEETINRGILLPEVESRFGSWIALLVTSTIFAGYHTVLTTDPTPVAVAAIFGASVLFAGAYLLTRQLWLPIALHAGWNFAQGAVFGIAVSGNDASSVALLAGETVGPTWLTGGTYGLEGSLVTLAVIVLAALAVVWQVHRRKLAAPRSWPRR
jgi:membrane protease YdiL (CAAX protease family)